MDKLTQVQKDRMYDDIAELTLKYGRYPIAKRMIKAFFERVKTVTNTREFSAMEITLVSLQYLLEITFPTR